MAGDAVGEERRAMELDKQPSLTSDLAPPTTAGYSGGASSQSAAGMRGKLAALAIAAALIGGGAWFGASTYLHPPPAAVGITTTTGEGTPFAGRTFARDDQLSQQQWQQRADQFQQFTSQGPARLERLTRVAGVEYLAKATLDQTRRAQLQQQVQDGTVEMVAIGFYDDCAEDGDVVRVQSGGIDVVISLLHRVQYVQIPVPKGQAVQVTVSGIRDGTGGITLGMVTPTGDVHVPRIAPGDQISFQAR